MERIGIIGGSGLYKLDGISKVKSLNVTTPFGKPSDKLILAQLGGREIVFLPRHGVGHRINPSEINYRANIYALKKLNVGHIVSVTACGSLKQHLKPMDFVVLDQFIDRTNQARSQTFFEEGIVAHVSLAHPTCSCLTKAVKSAAKHVKVDMHYGGTYVNMEGPQFSTLAESKLYRSWGMDVIGMTNMVEARLAREAEICYVSLAAVTDYDCWHSDHKSVTVEMIINYLTRNIKNAKAIIKELIPKIPKERTCSCSQALKFAIITDRSKITPAVKKRLAPIIKKYI